LALATAAKDMSYAKSSRYVSGGEISRQTVMGRVRRSRAADSIGGGDIIPNGYPIDSLLQADINLMFSHINATHRNSLNHKTPYKVFSFFYGEKIAQA
ncbi:MAG: hypothetical protein PHP68_00715, partial [Oscillospiraceae bacterium]|nr:hypothetical protein [Oscillospiraceae bacterium]